MKKETETTKAGERTQHTPGPWTLRKGPHDALTDGWIIYWGDGNMQLVEVADLPLSFDALGRPKGEAEANARLIAAAPELLEALKSVVNDLQYGTTGRWKGEGSATLRAVISKAERK